MQWNWNNNTNITKSSYMFGNWKSIPKFFMSHRRHDNGIRTNVKLNDNEIYVKQYFEENYNLLKLIILTWKETFKLMK